MARLTRFAPSPTGRLHLGHALAAKEAFGFGPCLLRIEDIDHTRCKKEHSLGIYEDLNWLGFDWPIPVRVQSRHYLDYAKVVANLIERGLAYPCALTRTELKNGKEIDKGAQLKAANFMQHFGLESDPTPHPSLPYAIRLNLSKALSDIGADALMFSETGSGESQDISAKDSLTRWAESDRPDPIIARKDIGVSYHIAVTHDDMLQGITHVVRGMDLFDETLLHVLIQRLMEWPTPIYNHHGLLKNEEGKKLSKRGLDTSLQSLRENGLTAAQVLAMATP